MWRVGSKKTDVFAAFECLKTEFQLCDIFFESGKNLLSYAVK